jgi:hypothetical protein
MSGMNKRRDQLEIWVLSYRLTTQVYITTVGVAL